MKVEIFEWIIPCANSKHKVPYGTLRITNNRTTKLCEIQGCAEKESVNYQYVIFDGKRYKVTNLGKSYTPKLKLELIE
jgi:hypothetical protein